MSKNKIWVGITSEERVQELLTRKHILIRPQYCICVDTEPPTGMVEATDEILEAFDITDRQWLLGTSRTIFAEQADSQTEAAQNFVGNMEVFLNRFEQELRNEEIESGRGKDSTGAE